VEISIYMERFQNVSRSEEDYPERQYRTLSAFLVLISWTGGKDGTGGHRLVSNSYVTLSKNYSPCLDERPPNAKRGVQFFFFCKPQQGYRSFPGTPGIENPAAL